MGFERDEGECLSAETLLQTFNKIRDHLKGLNPKPCGTPYAHMLVFIIKESPIQTPKR